jgi:hypothetical protein
VDEVVKLMTTNPPTISIETAQKILGRGPGELEKIKAMLNMTELYKNAMTEAQIEMKQNAAGENQPQPGEKKDGSSKKETPAKKE